METLVNFRDIGLYATQNGKKVIENRIFRSGELVGLSQADSNLLTDNYKIRTIFDFRNQEEIMQRPDVTIAGVAYRHIDIMPETNGKSSSLSDITETSMDPDEMMMAIYEELITTSAAREGYKDFLEALVSNEEGSSIFHCFAGKDRTGIGAALILGILNVSTEDIIRDYLLTNQQRKKANDLILSNFRESGMEEKELEKIAIMLYVKKEYLERALQIMYGNYGDIPGYVKESLGFSQSFINDMKSIYTR